MPAAPASLGVDAQGGSVDVESAAVSHRDARFRRLTPNGDLFAHFGVALDPPVAESVAPVVRVAAGCRHCGWFVDVGADACPICGQPAVRSRPSASAPPDPSDAGGP